MIEFHPDKPANDAAHPKAAIWAMRLTALVAIVVSLFLWSESSRQGGGSLPGCPSGTSFDCKSVLASKWSMWLFDCPTSVLALALYVVVFVALLYVGPQTPAKYRRVSWWLLLAASIMAFGAAVWFIVLQVFIMKTICVYCMAAHACAIVLTGLVFRNAPLRRKAPLALGRRTVVLGLVVGLAGVGGLIAGQIVYEPPLKPIRVPAGTGQQDTDTGPGPNRLITLLKGRIRLRPHDFPVLGSADAKHIVVCLFDFTCPHCHAFHADLIEMLDRYMGQVAVVPLPVPFDSKCNRNTTKTEPHHEGACARAKLGLAVWKAKRDAYVEFDTWMFGADAPRPLDDARQKAIELVGEKALDAALADPWIQQRIENNIGLYEIVSVMSGRPVIPQLVVGGWIVAGRPTSSKVLFKLLEKEAGFAPPAGEKPTTEQTEPANTAPTQESTS